ncbi:MAG TPA: thioredoxin-dependent thiol peroxidase [Alphaproteobacteria bacterium]|nr:thioredoxin-dependent thiol peroxidase [Alphaproteobacteria bacterium]
MSAQAPHFKLQNQNGKWIDLADLQGKWTVLYFYPKAMTSGCTVQACGLRDAMADLRKKAAIYGVSGDPLPMLQQFIDKESLNFDLLSDPDHKVADAYGAYGEKSMYGRKYLGFLRNTYIIDPQGKLVETWEKVDPKTHTERLTAWFAEHA